MLLLRRWLEKDAAGLCSAAPRHPSRERRWGDCGGGMNLLLSMRLRSSPWAMLCPVSRLIFEWVCIVHKVFSVLTSRFFLS